MAAKPTKQQIAQAKARAGGNNHIKVTNAGLKKLGGAAVLAASFTPVGRGVKAAGTVAKVAGKVAKEVASSPKIVRKIQGKQMVKQTKKNVNAIADIQQKVKAETIAKNSVKSIPAGSKPLTKKTSGKPNYIYKDKEMAAVKESLKNVKLKKQGKK
jgi:hypothetical protein